MTSTAEDMQDQIEMELTAEMGELRVLIAKLEARVKDLEDKHQNASSEIYNLQHQPRSGTVRYER